MDPEARVNDRCGRGVPFRIASHVNPFDPRACVQPATGGRSPEIGRPTLTVREAMTRNVRSCRPDDTLASAAVAMCEADCRFLPVLDRFGHPIGVVTDGDICLLGATDHRRLRDIFVREGMSGPPATCRANDDLPAALKTMRERRIRHLPVVDAEGVLEGVLSLTDVVLCSEEESGHRLRQAVAETLRAIVQKHGDWRAIRHNSFIED